MARRSDHPTPGAIRSRQTYRLRQRGFAFSRAILSGAVLAMLVRAGKLADTDVHDEAEIERAVTNFLFELAGEKNFKRVSEIMRERWRPETQNVVVSTD